MKVGNFYLAAASALSIAAAASLLSGCEPANSQPHAGMPPPEVAVVTVQPQSVPATFEYIGQTAGSREVEVRARVTGIVLKRNYREGAPVAQGQSMFTIDPAPFEVAAARAEAALASAEAKLAQAKRNSARLKPLFEIKAASQKDYDDTVSAEAIGAADVKAAQARLTEAKLNLSYTKVESPVSGITGRSMRQEGSLISGPDALLTSITQVDPIWVNFGIPDNEQAQIQKEVQAKQLALPKDGNFEVALRRADGSLHEKTGRLNFADVRVSPQTGTRETRAELPNPGGALKPGEFVRVILRGATRPNAVTVPQRAVLEGPQGKFVYVVNEKSQAEPRPVEAGEWAGQSWIIISGLKPGDRVIVDGVMRLGPGAPVRIAEAKPEAAKPAAKE